MKIIIAGSRDVTDYEVVRQAVIESGYWKEFGKSIEVISGTARGVDRLGEEFARKNGLIVHRFPADWDTHGNAAGHIRNRVMGDFAKEHDGRIIAVYNGISPGTKGMIAYARDIDLKGFIYRTDKPLRYRKDWKGLVVTTDYSGKITEHKIVARMHDCPSQSRIMFQVTPAVPKSGGKDSFIDSDWFTAKENE